LYLKERGKNAEDTLTSLRNAKSDSKNVRKKRNAKEANQPPVKRKFSPAG